MFLQHQYLHWKNKISNQQQISTKIYERHTNSPRALAVQHAGDVQKNQVATQEAWTLTIIGRMIHQSIGY